MPMIHFVRFPKRIVHTDRSYLTQWFLDDILVVTDVDINDEEHLEQLIDQHRCKNVIVDLSHNAMPDNELPEFLYKYPIITSMYDQWYCNNSKIYFFPLWLWMFSCRSNQFFQEVVFDASGKKSHPMMCVNRNLSTHRVKFRELLDPVVDKIIYTFGTPLSNNDIVDNDGRPRIDISVRDSAYSNCAVNLVTETVVDRQSLSEKSCKPFIARQIPVIVGPQNCNKFLSDLGLDMFSDLIPWQTWDNESDYEIRLQKISAFVIDWINKGTVLDDYRRVQPRVEQNKQYFHSDAFRQRILYQMPVANPY